MSAVKLIIGNWKMNGLLSDSRERAKAIAAAAGQYPKADIVLCPPATVLQAVSEAAKGSAVRCGGQDCHEQASGAFTGDVSASMLKDLGCAFVIVGHSERRREHNEASKLVAAKARAAHAAGLVAVICVGETDADRTTGRAGTVVSAQLQDSFPDTVTPENTVVAYEPVWAIGTGKTATPDDIRSMHAIIRARTNEKMRILYGGSVKASNAKEILHLPNVDGVLVGGASLQVPEFLAIAQGA